MAELSRRAFLISTAALLSAPALVRASVLMPVKVAALDYLPGDHLSFEPGMYRATGFFAVSGHVKRVEGQHVVLSHFGDEVRIHGSWTRLFHGLPGNRVDNPSQRHRLFRPPGRIGR